MRGRAYEAGGQLPYYPVVEALRTRLETILDPRQVLSEIWLAELCRLFPELAERVPYLPPAPALPEVEARSRLFESVARLGQGLVARAPLVLFVDDLQWADAASFELLSYVVHRWAATGTPLLLQHCGTMSRPATRHYACSLYARRSHTMSKPEPCWMFPRCNSRACISTLAAHMSL